MLKSNFAMGAGDAGANATIANPAGVGATGKFVIHLCSVGAPITIPQPRSPELVRYRFFLHTCWEEGVKRHRLYMGHFATRPEAEKWLVTLRRIYPSAFVSEPPRGEVLSGPQIVSLLDQGPTPTQQRPVARPARVTTGAPQGAAPTPTATARAPTSQTGTFRALGATEKTTARPGTATTQKRRSISLEETLEDLKAATPDFDEEDSLSATGVRHLKIEIQEDTRAKGRRPGARK